jgi:hypothetical protein
VSGIKFGLALVFAWGLLYAIPGLADHDREDTSGLNARPPAVNKTSDLQSADLGSIRMESVPEETRLQFVNTALTASIDEFNAMNAGPWDPIRKTGDVTETDLPPQPLDAISTNRGPQPPDFQ